MTQVFARKCGHWTEKEGIIQSLGESRFARLSVNEDGTTDYCLEYIRAMTKQCAWCGNPIFVGDPVILLPPDNLDYQPPWQNYKIYRISEDLNLFMSCPDCVLPEPVAECCWGVGGVAHNPPEIKCELLNSAA